MEHTKKMILVDPRMLDSLQQTSLTSPAVPDATSHSLSEMDRVMRDIIDRKDVDVNSKADLYQQVLWRFLKRYGQFKDKPLGKVEMSQPTPVIPPDGEVLAKTTSKIEDRVLSSVPKTLQNKARLLLDHVKDNADVGWNERGELVYQGQTVEGTNMSDLVNDMLRQRKKAEDPRGWEIFAQALKAANVPRELIGHTKRWNWIDQRRGERGRAPIRSRVRRLASLSPKSGPITPVMTKKPRRKRQLFDAADWTQY